MGFPHDLERPGCCNCKLAADRFQRCIFLSVSFSSSFLILILFFFYFLFFFILFFFFFFFFFLFFFCHHYSSLWFLFPGWFWVLAPPVRLMGLVPWTSQKGYCAKSIHILLSLSAPPSCGIIVMTEFILCQCILYLNIQVKSMSKALVEISRAMNKYQDDYSLKYGILNQQPPF